MSGQYNIVEFCELSFIGYFVMTQLTDFFHHFKDNNSVQTGAILTKCAMHPCVW